MNQATTILTCSETHSLPAIQPRCTLSTEVFRVIGIVTGAVTGAAVGFAAPYAAASAGSRASAVAVTAFGAGVGNLAQQGLTYGVYTIVDPSKASISGSTAVGAAVAGPVAAGAAKAVAAYGQEVVKTTASIFGATLPAVIPKMTFGTKAAGALYEGTTGGLGELIGGELGGGSGGKDIPAAGIDLNLLMHK